MPKLLRLSVPLAALWAAACSNHRADTADTGPATARLLVTAGTAQLEPATGRPPAVSRSEVDGQRVTGYYRLTTPAGTPFAFDLVSWQPGASGDAQVAVRHLRQGGRPTSGDGSWIDAGILPQGHGITVDQGWLGARGDGFVRLSLSGSVQKDQLIAVDVEDEVALVEIAIGPESQIRRGRAAGEPGAAATAIYSSNSSHFGLPTVAVSGDRTSIVCYEGDQQDQSGGSRYELRLQHNRTTAAVTGGASRLASADSGYWRDHEVAALFNVLAVVRGEPEGVRLRLSFDRGATFAQEVPLIASPHPSRLVQMALAADYTLAIAAWRQNTRGDQLEFVVIEGQPVSYDAGGSPTWYAFQPAQVLRATSSDTTPLTSGVAWSAGGDLVVGYGATSLARDGGPQWTSTTEFRCATRRFGETLIDREVERFEMVGIDPTVAVSGQGSSLRIFYAYEVAEGVRLATSADGGNSFTTADTLGLPGDHLPTVLVRETAGEPKVDVLWLGWREGGLELNRTSWAAWPSSPRRDERLTQATSSTVNLPMVPGAPPPPWPFMMQTTQVSWLGYDAVIDGDALVVVYDEVTSDNFVVLLPWANAQTGTSASGSLPPVFRPATPPPLAPGLTEPVRSVDPAHAHQLRLLRL